MSLLEEAKARQAKTQAAKSTPGENPFQRQTNTNQDVRSAPKAQVDLHVGNQAQHYQQVQQQQAASQGQEQYNVNLGPNNPPPPQPPQQQQSSLMQSQTLGASSLLLPPQQQVNVNAPPSQYSSTDTLGKNLTPKEQAKLARENWKSNATKINMKDTSTALADGGSVAPRWVPNKEQLNCTRCNSAFDWITRKHHCRRCGLVFCGECTGKKALLPKGTSAKDSDTRNPRKVCLDCYEVLVPQQQTLARMDSNSMKDNTLDLQSKSARYLNSPIRFTMGAEIRKAAYIIRNFHTGLESKIEDSSMPLKLIRDCCGLAILTVMKVGFVWTGRLGTGLVISRRGDGSWSPPSAIMMAGCGFGAQVGGEVTDIVIVLTSQAAVTAFTSKGQVQIGGELSVAVGPLGRSAEGALRAGDKGLSSCISYSHSKGFFAGVSIEGAIVSQRPDINKNFYGQDYTPSQLLQGDIPPAVAAKPLYECLKTLLDSDPSVKARQGFVDNSHGVTAQQKPAYDPLKAMQAGAAAGAAQGAVNGAMQAAQHGQQQGGQQGGNGNNLVAI